MQVFKKSFGKKLINWYHQNKRDLPWRQTSDPYKIWLSEIILQQTRVDQGLNYYLKFVQEFPTVKNLAEADEQKVLRLWQGLGYYSRARNLHSAARYIRDNYNSEFPQNYPDILNLKGVGHYSAAAIASIAFGLPHAVVDGNVYRVLSRIFGIKTPVDSTKGKNAIKNLADELIVPNDSGNYNEAIMEFGATYCVKNNPKCSICIFSKNCVAYKNNLVNDLPVKTKKILKRERYFNYYVFRQNGHSFLRKRIHNDIWKNLYEFPLIETTENYTKERLVKILEEVNLVNSNHIKAIREPKSYKQTLTHQKIIANFIEIEVSKDFELDNLQYQKVGINDIQKYPFPKIVACFVSENALF